MDEAGATALLQISLPIEEELASLETSLIKLVPGKDSGKLASATRTPTNRTERGKSWKSSKKRMT